MLKPFGPRSRSEPGGGVEDARAGGADQLAARGAHGEPASTMRRRRKFPPDVGDYRTGGRVWQGIFCGFLRRPGRPNPPARARQTSTAAPVLTRGERRSPRAHARRPSRTGHAVCGHPRAPARRRRAAGSRRTTRSAPTSTSRSSTPPRRPRSSPSASRSSAASFRSRSRRPVERGGRRVSDAWGRPGGGGGRARPGTRPRRARSRAAARARRDTPRAGGGPCARRAGRCRGAAPRTRASRGRASPSPCSAPVWSNSSSASRATCCVCSTSELQRRAKPATDARRSARGSSDQSSDRGTRTASSTMPSRSAQSLAIMPSSSNSRRSSTSSVEPAGRSSARLLLEPGHAPPLRRRIRMMRRCSARELVGLDAAGRSCSRGSSPSPVDAAAMRARSLSVPLVPTAICGWRPRTSSTSGSEVGRIGRRARPGRLSTAGRRARAPR